MTRARAFVGAVPQRVWTAVAGLALIASLAVSVLIGAGLSAWRSAVGGAAQPPPSLLQPAGSGLIVVPGAPNGRGPRPSVPTPEQPVPSAPTTLLTPPTAPRVPVVRVVPAAFTPHVPAASGDFTPKVVEVDADEAEGFGRHLARGHARVHKHPAVKHRAHPRSHGKHGNHCTD
ncbi:MAG: hypothetical protein QOC82_1853 [Frankiaceae bacterium]|jgi:hypothetical protein|nr:hypothetical protein [Frankiaceae bacterium]